MDLNRGAVAPYEPNKGARRPGLVAHRLGGGKWRDKKKGNGRTPGLRWPPFDRGTQQPTNSRRRRWQWSWRGEATGAEHVGLTPCRRLVIEMINENL